jgi:hypothetical protein
MTKKLSILFAILVLVLASLACQTLSGGGDAPELPAPSDDGGGEPQPETSGGSESDIKTDFPIPVGATNIQNLGGTINFQVEMSLEAAMGFYRNEFTVKGYTERPILTVTSETTFSMVFDGHESGKAIVVQGVDMSDGTVNVNIRLEDV